MEEGLLIAVWIDQSGGGRIHSRASLQHFALSVALLMPSVGFDMCYITVNRYQPVQGVPIKSGSGLPWFLFYLVARDHTAVGPCRAGPGGK